MADTALLNTTLFAESPFETVSMRADKALSADVLLETSDATAADNSVDVTDPPPASPATEVIRKDNAPSAEVIWAEFTETMAESTEIRSMTERCSAEVTDAPPTLTKSILELSAASADCLLEVSASSAAEITLIAALAASPAPGLSMVAPGLVPPVSMVIPESLLLRSMIMLMCGR
jgi:hypothetical protein